MERIFDLSPEKGFFKQVVVKRLVIGMAAWAVASTLFMSVAAVQYESCWTVDCINFYFLTVLRVPLGGLALFSAALLLLAAHHRSEQSAYSFRLVAEQNNFSNYFLHFKEFKDYWQTIPQGVRSLCPDCSTIYANLYPNARRGGLRLSENYSCHIYSDLDVVSANLNGLIEHEGPVLEFDNTLLVELIEKTTWLARHYEDTVSSRNRINAAQSLQSAGAEYFAGNEGFRSVLVRVDSLVKILDAAFKFSPYREAHDVRVLAPDWETAFYKYTKKNIVI